MRVWFILHFNPASTFKSACTTHSMQIRTHAMHQTHARARKLKKSNGVLMSMISTLKSQTGHSDNVFHMFHVPSANRVLSSHFLRDRKLEKNVVIVRIREFWGLYIKVASVCFNFLFFVSLGCLIPEISGVKIENKFSCLNSSHSVKKSRTESSKTWI